MRFRISVKSLLLALTIVLFVTFGSWDLLHPGANYSFIGVRNYFVSFISNSMHRYPDESSKLQIGNKDIFMIETNDRKGTVRGRVLCALESAARHNPTRNVFLLLSTTSKVKNTTGLIPNLKNFHVIRTDFDQIMKDTPCEAFWQSAPYEESMYEVVHKSDILKSSIIYKYGGTYMDTGK